MKALTSLTLSPVMAAAMLASAPLAAQTSAPAITPAINEANIVETVKTLTLPTFEGRAPGTKGEDVTIGYLIGRLSALGLEPAGPDGQWTQDVPLLHTKLTDTRDAAVALGGKRIPLAFGKDYYASTLQPKDRAVIDGAPMVFVGYGVSAPERQWDDFKGVDLKGKVAVFLVNDPDFEAAKSEAVAGRFGGKAMTYYGRWTYKFEEAARRGAVGALIVHDTPGAGYDWSVVNAPAGENYGLVVPEDKRTSLALQGWIEGGAATRLFADAGLDLAKLRKAARTAAFKPVDISGARFQADIKVDQKTVISRNVLAKITGTTKPDEVVSFGAHWDAYGEDATHPGQYRAGANDDGIGVAGLFEIARVMKSGPAPKRTVLFGFWTAEERGLLGSEYYVQNPTMPLAKTVANLGIDVLQTAGKAKNVVLIGKGQSTLEDDLARVAATQGRVVSPESLPERGLFYRADHFSFAKRGVPVLLMMGIAGASDLVDGGLPAGQAWIDDYTGRCYHKACDAYGPEWKMAGALEDIETVRIIGTDLANSDAWPTWKKGSEFAGVKR